MRTVNATLVYDRDNVLVGMIEDDTFTLINLQYGATLFRIKGKRPMLRAIADYLFGVGYA